MSSALDLVTTLISESEQLVSLAESEEWGAFSELEQERQSHVKQLDLRSVDLPEQQNLELRNQMAVLIVLNDKIEAICREKRSKTVKDLKKLNQGNKAKKAYT